VSLGDAIASADRAAARVAGSLGLEDMAAAGQAPDRGIPAAGQG
jgi:hypothetical protein